MGAAGGSRVSSSPQHPPRPRAAAGGARCIQPQQSPGPLWSRASNNTLALIKAIFFISFLHYLIITSERAKEFLLSPPCLPIPSLPLFNPLPPAFFCPFDVLSLPLTPDGVLAFFQHVDMRKPHSCKDFFVLVGSPAGSTAPGEGVFPRVRVPLGPNASRGTNVFARDIVLGKQLW